MSTKKIIVFGKMLALLLLVSFSAAARTSIAIDTHEEQKKQILGKAQQSFHRNMLQPHAANLTVTFENPVKPAPSGYFVLPGNEKISLLMKSPVQASVLLQDADRCESVSKLLFPFHYFW